MKGLSSIKLDEKPDTNNVKVIFITNLCLFRVIYKHLIFSNGIFPWSGMTAIPFVFFIENLIIYLYITTEYSPAYLYYMHLSINFIIKCRLFAGQAKLSQKERSIVL